jgi:sialate O-acetylesterase
MLLGFFAALQVQATSPFVHQLFTSHMVLQRNAEDPIWGWASPGVTVTVKVFDQNSLLLQTKTAVADSGGRWQTTVGPFGLVPNNAAYSLTISAPGQTTVTLTDVLVGDVWLCSGQSNMDWAVSGVYNATAEIADSVNYPAIRCFTVPQVTSLTAQSNLSGGTWIVSGPAATGGFTAVGYFMAREIYKQQGIPIGILRSSWGGTIIQAWSDPAFVAGIADFTQTVFDQSVQVPYNNTVSGLYNAMILPLAPLRIKAVNWYQGEFNAGTPEQYGRMLPGLMSSWRTLFGQPHLPFIIVQLPNADPSEASNWAELREAQAKTVANDPDSRLVVTLDIGGGVLHPLDKQDVGLRSAWAAANLVYGKAIVDQAPAFAGFSVSGTNVTCTFTNVGGGLMLGSKNYTNPITPTQPVAGGTVKGFLLAGADQVFYSANAVIAASNTVVVSSPSVAQPVAVRYAWLTYPDCNLYNQITNAPGQVVDGLPAGSFRSDPVNKLNVNNGCCTSDYALGARATITASGNPTGEVFDHWSGDTNLLANALSPTATVTISQPYVSMLANYRITGAPSGLTATPQPGQVTLNWNPMTWVHYNVKRSATSAGPYTTLAASLYATNSFVDTNATEGITFYYAVSATNLLGEGPNSAPVNVTTTGNAVLNRSGWVASASASAAGNPSTNAIDGNINTRWSTGAAQSNGQWFQVDMGSPKSFFRIVLDAGASSGDYPQGYQVNVSNDGINWGSPVAAGTGSSAVTAINFPVQTARYIRVTQTGSSSGWWSIHEFYVYSSITTPSALTATAGNAQVALSWATAPGATSYNIKRATLSGGPYTIVFSSTATNCLDTGLYDGTTYYYVVSGVNAGGESTNSAEATATPSATLALNRAGWVASASDGSASASNAIDGDITTRWTTGALQANGQWFQVDMGSTNTFSQIVLDAANSSGDYPRGYQVNLSNDGSNWGTPVTTGAGSSAVTTISFSLQTARFIRVTQTGTSGGWWSIHEFNVYGGASAPPIRTNYTNGLGGKWSSVIWQPNPPGQPASGTQTAILFANSALINSTNDLGSFTLNELMCANQPVNLAGAPLVFDGTTPLVTNLQSCPFTIANALTLNQTTDFEITSNIATLGGGVSGSGGLSKGGAGAVVLLGTNSYSGGTMVNDGILQLGDGTTNGMVAGSIVNNSPALGGVTFNNGAAQTNSTGISGFGSVAKNGGATLTWGAQGAYTGLTSINGGTLVNASGVNGLGASWAPVNINSNATWIFNNASVSAGSLALTNGNCGVNRNGNLNFTNAVSSGVSTIGVSELKIGADQIGGIYTALFNVTDGTLTLNINKLWNYAGGTLNATSGVVKTGAGTVLIANLGSSYKGSTTLSGGVWQVSILANGGTDSHIGQSSSAATNLVLNGGTLKYTGGAVAIDRLFSLGTSGGTLDASGSGALTLNNAGPVGFVDSGTHTLTLAGTSGSANTLAASLGDNSGPTALFKIATGSWTLSGANSFSGGTVVSGGTLTVAAGATLGTGNLTVSNGASCLIQNAAALGSGAWVFLNGTMNLANNGTNSVSRLYIGGVLQAAGLWNATRDAMHFAGAGSLNVTGGLATGPVVLSGSGLAGGGLKLSWTNGATDLYFTPSLTPPVVWAPVTNPPLFSNGQWSVALPGSLTGNGFYRLQQ